MNRQLQHEETVEKASWFGRRFGRKHVPENVQTDTEIKPTEAAVEEARIVELQQAVRRRTKNLRVGRIAMLIAVFAVPVTATFSVPILIASAGRTDSLFPVFMFSAVGVCLSSYFIGMINALRGMKRLKEAATALADTEDVRAVGPFAEVLKLPDPAHVTAAVALNRLLPRLQAQDAGLLDEKQRASLYRALRASTNPRSLKFYNPEFALTVLRSLEKVGDAKAISIVERLASGKAKTPAQQRIRQAAAACLPYLKMRADAGYFEMPLSRAGEDREVTQENTLLPVQRETAETLIRQMQAAAQARKRDYKISFAGIAVGVAFLAPTMLMEIASPTSKGSSDAFLIGELAIGGSILYLRYRASRIRGVASALLDTDDLRIVGPLADTLETQEAWTAVTQDAWTQAMVRKALTQLLPRLRASDAALLNTDQRARLCRKLDTLGKHKMDKQSADFAVAILKALEQVGDGSALPSVERLATIKAKTPMQKRVQEAALACLPFLQARAEHQLAEETLLRASAESVTPPEVLLRPAASGVAVETENLLRAGVSPEEKGETR